MIETSKKLDMEFMKFSRSSYDGFLRMREASNLQIEIIGMFLESDLCFFSEDYLKWLKTDSLVTGGNLTYVYK